MDYQPYKTIPAIVVPEETFDDDKRHWKLALFHPNGTPFLSENGELNTGPSAYDVAVANGFEGTEEDWLESLIGTNGTNGTNGATGPTGPMLVVTDWATATAYALNSYVSYNGSIYRTSTAHTSGGSFDATKFTVVVTGAPTVYHTRSNSATAINTNGTTAVRDIDALSIDAVIGVREVIIEVDIYAFTSSGIALPTFQIYDVTAASVSRIRLKNIAAGAFDSMVLKKRFPPGELSPGLRTFKPRFYSSGAPVISTVLGDGANSDSWIRVIC